MIDQPCVLLHVKFLHGAEGKRPRWLREKGEKGCRIFRTFLVISFILLNCEWIALEA